MEALQSCYSLLNPGGILFITVPACNSLWSYFDQVSHHFRRYEKYELEEKITTVGYNIEYITYYMSGIFPFVWLKRKIFKINDQKAKTSEINTQIIEKEFHINTILNKFFNLILSREIKIIGERRPLPFGTSLMGIFQKPN